MPPERHPARGQTQRRTRHLACRPQTPGAARMPHEAGSDAPRARLRTDRPIPAAASSNPRRPWTEKW